MAKSAAREFEPNTETINMADKLLHEFKLYETENGFRIEVNGDKEKLKKMGFGPGMMFGRRGMRGGPRGRHGRGRHGRRRMMRGGPRGHHGHDGMHPRGRCGPKSADQAAAQSA